MQGAGNLIFLGLLFVIFYFMLIRPNKKRAEAHRQLIQSIDAGDEVVTAGGMHGTVQSVGESEMEIEISPGTVARFEKSYILRRVTEDLEDEDAEVGDTGSEEERSA